MAQKIGMVVPAFFQRQTAARSELRKSAWLLAVSAIMPLAALPVDAVAQTEITAAAPNSCDPGQNNRPYALSFATMTRVEPGAGREASTKASAILGGAMSRLEQMRSVQAASDATLTLPSPSSMNMQAVQNLPSCEQPGNTAFSLPSPELFTDTILGAQSVNISRTPFDRDWAAVQMRPNNPRVHHAVSASGARASRHKLQQLQMINRWVNKNIAFGDDQSVYRRADYWAPASETLRRGIGDCEDFAIAKMEMLSALGFARDDMRLIIARDLVRNADHAVLVVKLDNSSVVLDNATDRLLDGRLPNDYRPILSFSRNAKWVHGYNVQQPATVRLAALPASVVPASGQVHDVIAVTAEPEMPAVSVAWLNVPSVLPTLL